ncbi:uncharacterized protein DUF3592 [Murinocardiopsis flavida]|uniref:Uncharacterized protein DUF3592 n=1 Tax=Murinocardiopsis flavida TaxID=645275 RepID=A0A2P8DIX2_9ACTN|nr:DUF3592 domain-containing protein [Murinocardiopsis flavida]PSK97176.1 uncharacterized protein DUF3592 [Murinocardiopsis flavida]
MAQLYPLIPIAVGLGLLAWQFHEMRLGVLLTGRGRRAEGEIVGYRETSSTARIMVRFHTDDGREVMAAHNNAGWAAARAGDQVTVSYDPDSPEAARVVEAPWLSNWVHGMYLALGAALALIGAFLGYLAWL